MTQLKGTVGRGGINYSTDVRQVQALLNRHLPELGLPSLRVDGIVGDFTIIAIETFQREAVHLDPPDGRVDPNGRTLMLLSQDRRHHLPASSTRPGDGAGNRRIPGPILAPPPVAPPQQVVDPTGGDAPWMILALNEALRWAGKNEAEITEGINYHAEVDSKNTHKTLAGDAHPWCAAFVNYCLLKAGFACSVLSHSSRSFERDKNFRRVPRPVYGALVVWKNLSPENQDKGTGHVAFVYSRYAALGGNQGDAINFRALSASKNHPIVGYFLPRYYMPSEASSQGEFLSGDTAETLNQKMKLKKYRESTR